MGITNSVTTTTPWMWAHHRTRAIILFFNYQGSEWLQIMHPLLIQCIIGFFRFVSATYVVVQSRQLKAK